MHIFLDRNLCNRWVGCEACFANHLLSEDFNQADCVQNVVDTHQAELVFRITDRDHSFKTLVVKEENFNQALASWVWLWEQQAGPII
ncbi:MAG: hypothetical protein WD740_04465 [Anaerolineales bacterium]